jgi:hypothetical protein
LEVLEELAVREDLEDFVEGEGEVDAESEELS